MFKDGGNAIEFFEFDSGRFAATGDGLGNFDIIAKGGSLTAGDRISLRVSDIGCHCHPVLHSMTNNLEQFSFQHSMPLSMAQE